MASKVVALQGQAMDWIGGHLQEFIIDDTHYGEPDPDYPELARYWPGRYIQSPWFSIMWTGVRG